MSQQDPPIIVSGGSVTIDFNQEIFKPNGNGKHSNANKKIKRIEITIGGEKQTIDVPNGKVTVEIHYGNS